MVPEIPEPDLSCRPTTVSGSASFPRLSPCGLLKQLVDVLSHRLSARPRRGHSGGSGPFRSISSVGGDNRPPRDGLDLALS